MPRCPAVGSAPGRVRANPFSLLADRIARHQGELFALHVGDTWMEPADGSRMEDLRVADLPGMHRYTRPRGHPELIGALSERLDVDERRLLVAAGATGALSTLAGALLDPGDEVLVLAPFWPLIRGIVSSAHAVPVEVPFYDRPGSVEALLGPRVTPRTAALYVNSPNNPTGRVLDADRLAELAAFARKHDLWLLSDEVYEHYAYVRPHHPLAVEAPERTFTVRSFSKAYGMAGNRVGYVVGPSAPAPMAAARKIATHLCYQAPTAGQLAAARVLVTGDAWLDRARASYRAAGDDAARALGLPPPEGGTFLFVDVADQLDERGLLGFLERCLDRGLLLAPGGNMGEAYASRVRVCFTCEPPDVVRRGVAVLAGLLGR
jgi:aspartate/methionine/tyrosine aminotransferase